MSSPCLYAEDTIARCIAVAMKPLGGRKPGLIRPLRLVRCGSKRVRYQPVNKNDNHSPIECPADAIDTTHLHQ